MSQLIFLTGASGFLGSHIATQLLTDGYRVRATARGRRVAELRRSYAKYGGRFEVVDVPDLSTDQFPEALEGVDGLIHTAAPLADRAEPDEILKGAVDGTLNIIRQAHKAGIKNIVVTSSIVTVSTLINANPSCFTESDWYAVDKDKALEGTKWDVYCAAKTLAEQELWAFNEAHPELEITTINPPFLYGPFPEGFTQPTPDYYALSTNIQIYRFLKPSSRFPPFPGYADIRDCAKAHILALKGPPTASVGRKRVIFCSPHGYDFKNVLELIADKRPELRGRLNKEKPPTFTFDRVPIDFGRIEDIVGLRKGDFRAPEETFLDTVDALLVMEAQWVALGHKVNIPDS